MTCEKNACKVLSCTLIFKYKTSCLILIYALRTEVIKVLKVVFSSGLSLDEKNLRLTLTAVCWLNDF